MIHHYLLVLLSVVATRALPPQFKRLVVFGDSYSDDGPNYHQRHRTDNYGFFRTSNGKVWNEHLSRALCLNLFNYAHTGAMSGVSNLAFTMANLQIPVNDTWSGLEWQVRQYLQDVSGKVPDTDLIAYQMGGGNDGSALVMKMMKENKEKLKMKAEAEKKIRKRAWLRKRDLDSIVSGAKALYGGWGRLKEVEALGKQIGKHNVYNLRQLIEAGSKNILVLGLPDPVHIPRVKEYIKSLGFPDIIVFGPTDTLRNVQNRSNAKVCDFLAQSQNSTAGATFKFVRLDLLVKRLEDEPYNLIPKAIPGNRSSWQNYIYIEDGVHPSGAAHKGVADGLEPIMKNTFGTFCTGAPITIGPPRHSPKIKQPASINLNLFYHNNIVVKQGQSSSVRTHPKQLKKLASNIIKQLNIQLNSQN